MAQAISFIIINIIAYILGYQKFHVRPSAGGS